MLKLKQTQLYIINTQCLCICLCNAVILRYQPTNLASEVRSESPQPEEDGDYTFKTVLSKGDSIDAQFPRRHIYALSTGNNSFFYFFIHYVLFNFVGNKNKNNKNKE